MFGRRKSFLPQFYFRLLLGVRSTSLSLFIFRFLVVVSSVPFCSLDFLFLGVLLTDSDFWLEPLYMRFLSVSFRFVKFLTFCSNDLSFSFDFEIARPFD